MSFKILHRKFWIWCITLPILALPITAQGQIRSSIGREFWVMFLYNGGDQTPHSTRLTAVGDSNATITVTNPSTGWSTTATLSANQSVQITVPVASSSSDQSNSNQTKHLGLHITASSSISLYAYNYKQKCNDATLIYPSPTLGTQYIMQDYKGDGSRASLSGAEVGFVATMDSTTLTMVLPCNLMDNSAATGDTLKVNLMQGESYQLIAAPSSSFSGMEVTSNGKPFAAFQGNRVAYIPVGASGADLLYDQAVPIDYWGTEFVVGTTFGRSADIVRITSLENDCQIFVGNEYNCTLQKGETVEFSQTDGSTSGAVHYTSTKKVCVGRYLLSNSSGGSPGDPSSVTVPPVDQGLQRIRFKALDASDFSVHYIAITVRNDYVSGVTLDGINISSQFTQVDSNCDYSFARISISSGTHLLESSLGTLLAEYYSLGSYASHAYLLGRSFVQPLPEPEDRCPQLTNKGRDFWVMFLYNQNINPGTYTNQHFLTPTSDSNCTVTIENFSNGNTTQHSLNSNNIQDHLVGSNQLIVGTVYTGGIHVSSDKDIWLYARNFVTNTQDVATILPTSALDTSYIVQDYPSQHHGGEVGFVATLDNTILTMTVPCNVQGTSITAGSTLNVTLNRGQCYLLLAEDGNVSFSGMRVSSNGKPFAAFHGGWNPAVPSTASGRDHCYEQVLPSSSWGTEFVVAGTWAQNGDNRIRITAGESNCAVTINGNLTTTLNARETYEYNLNSHSDCHITTSKPVYVILYMGSFQNAGIGDPSSVTIPPISRGICDNIYKITRTTAITSTQHHLNIVCKVEHDAHMRLDGNALPPNNTSTVSGYNVHHITNSSDGVHHLENSAGPFIAYAYGTGDWESYAFPLGIAIDTLTIQQPEPQVHRDTVYISDSVCQGEFYMAPGFIVHQSQTEQPGLVTVVDSTVVDDTIIHYKILNLTVLPTSSSDAYSSIIAGDTLFYNGTAMTTAGDYTFVLTAANGCDSIVTFHLSYQGISLTSSADGVCPGESVTLSVEGTHLVLWSSTPYDPELDSQQGQNPVTVHPEVTTTYHLLDGAGNIIASVTVGVEPPPTLCIEANRDFIDFDHPVITLYDCSPESHSSTWLFSDGHTQRGERARRQFRPPLPDTITVTLLSCNRYNCCADTTIGFHPEIRSVWFPNIFTPDEGQNNRFGCITSCQVAEFEIYLYNRWGLLVWYSTDILDSWDGTHDGTPVPQGAYAYRWFLKDLHGDRWNGAGTVTLIR